MPPGPPMSDIPSPPEPPRPGPSRLTPVLFTLSLLVLLALLILLTVPGLMLRWWHVQAEAEAEAVYRKRQAELQAEYDAADARLADLDRRVHFVSLGFREVARKVAPAVVNVTNEVEVPEAGKRRLFYD